MKTFMFVLFLLICPFANAAEWDKYVGNAMPVVNYKRAEKNLYAYIETPELLELSKEISYKRGLTLHQGHLRKPLFTRRGEGEGVGWNSTMDLEGKEFISCFLYEKGFKYAGATYCVDDKKGTFYTLVLSNKPDKAELVITLTVQRRRG